MFIDDPSPVDKHLRGSAVLNVRTAMPPRSPWRSKRNQIQTCESVDFEFTRRALSLFASFYHTPSLSEISTFPAPPPSSDIPRDSRPPPTIPPFHSGVWDLRLQKSIENHRLNYSVTSRNVSEAVSQLKKSSEEVPDLSELFHRPKAERPEIPKYIQNLKSDREFWLQQIKRPQRIAIGELVGAGQLFKDRIAQRYAIGKVRSQRRFERIKELERKNVEFIQGLHRSPRPSELDVKQAAKMKEAARAEERRISKERTEDIVRQEGEILEAIRQSPRRPTRSSIIDAGDRN
jgi:hypothetical protein